MWVQGRTTHSRRVTAIPPARFVLNVEPLVATQSVLSMVSLSLLRLSMQQQSF